MTVAGVSAALGHAAPIGLFSGAGFDALNAKRRPLVTDGASGMPAARGGGMAKYDRPVLDFEADDTLTLNATNTKTMIRSYGADNRSWLGHVVELYLGEAEYEGETKPSVKVRPVSLPEHYGEVAEVLELDGPPAGSSEIPADGAF